MPRTSEPDNRPVIAFENVSKSFKIKHAHSFKQAFISAVKRKELSSHFNAVDDLSFEVPEGQSVALMGRNGSGKSTTLKLLSGVMDPDSGWVRVRGRIAGLLEVGAGFHPDLTGRENVYLNAAILGMSKEETDERFDEILAFSEIGDFIDTEVKRYSSGMYARLGFSVAVHTELDTLLVDEVLSVGDAEFRKKCERRMLELQEQGKTMFIVSHSANQVRKLCSRGIVLEHGRKVFDGPIDEALVRLQSNPDLVETVFPVTGSIYDLYSADPERFGAPIGPQREAGDRIRGLFQEFERGIITSHYPRGRVEPLTIGLSKGNFLAAYMRSGGPAGPWGFMQTGPVGNLDEFEPRVMEFTNGRAVFTLDDGLHFETTEVD
ncbi:ABC-type polysaccharide/polyol phosphate transport system ATPase subunit [Mycolicibacterium mucogenicum 261Sha1.1M5]|nr:ABC-type polysaccharide/polyol phosphate transport system ATPase subunit [Mycolicibacterium mucogenicum 261Sha1.1M5]